MNLGSDFQRYSTPTHAKRGSWRASFQRLVSAAAVEVWWLVSDSAIVYSPTPAICIQRSHGKFRFSARDLWIVAPDICRRERQRLPMSTHGYHSNVQVWVRFNDGMGGSAFCHPTYWLIFDVASVRFLSSKMVYLLIFIKVEVCCLTFLV